ncbi:MAG: hypothetical protein FWH01_07765, partial [Oscillospiraceae bacterium]|nr:hypothetical protein [Oscillospiraceae bacterium]
MAKAPVRDPFYGFRNTVITVGNFDGMHLGHMRLIGVLTRRAAELGARALVYTFDDHPKNVLDGGGSVKMLTDMRAKRSLLSRTAVDGLFFERFDRAFASLGPEEFIAKVFVGAFSVRLVVVGSDFRFGRTGGG